MQKTEEHVRVAGTKHDDGDDLVHKFHWCQHFVDVKRSLCGRTTTKELRMKVEGLRCQVCVDLMKYPCVDCGE